jgi:alpha-glucuronidase
LADDAAPGYLPETTMALTVVDRNRIRTAIRQFLEASVAAFENPAAAPAVSARMTELIKVVFPVAGITDRSSAMILEFQRVIIASVATATITARGAGLTARLTDVLELVYTNAKQLEP